MFVVSGKVDVDEIAERLGVDIEREGFETVGGYLLSHPGRVPGVGETFEVDDLTVEVLEAERRRIHKVRVRRNGCHSGVPAGRLMTLTPAQDSWHCSAGRTPASPPLLNKLVGEKLAIVSGQAADHPHAHPRGQELRRRRSRRPDRLRRHARRPPAAAPHERPHGRRRGPGRARRRRGGARRGRVGAHRRGHEVR